MNTIICNKAKNIEIVTCFERAERISYKYKYNVREVI